MYNYKKPAKPWGDQMIKVSVLGATGYTGQELVRLLYQHAEVKIVGLGTQNYVGQSFANVYPHFRGIIDIVCRSVDDEYLFDEADVVFLALPHGLSVPYVVKAINNGKKVVDLGADFRLKNQEVYEHWYKKTAPPADILAQAIYGLPEINRTIINNAVLLSNPGCYPTTAILGLAPLLHNKLVDIKDIIIDSKSGISGAGRSLSLGSMFSEAGNNFKAYGFPHHRHTPEIEQEISAIAGQEIKVSFTPHLLPMVRGMLSTIYIRPSAGTQYKHVLEAYETMYKKEPFVRVLPTGEFPNTKWVLGTNFCDIGLSWDERAEKIIIVSAIDNLVKGASGQAVQNMNIMFGLEESTGLKHIAVYP